MKILLPGLDRLYKQANRSVITNNKKIVVFGAGAESIARKISENSAIPVEIVLEDYEQLLNSRLIIRNNQSVICKLMDFTSTDYKTAEVDLIFAQASISNSKRKLILKEFARILKSEGNLIAGEIVALKKEIPPFVKNLFDISDLQPLFIGEIRKYYERFGWQILEFQDISFTLTDYYKETLNQFSKSIEFLTQEERSYYKKLINRIKHESNVYLKLGGNKFIGFVSLILRKEKKS